MRGILATVLTALLLVTAVAPAAAVQAPVQHDSTTTVEPCEFPVTLTDATGTEVTVEQKPERVTTLAPSAAQTMWSIGGKEQVVGLTQYALYLDGAESRTNVSASGFGVNVEKVVGTNPDLVLAPNVVSNQTVQKLRNAGLTVFKFEQAKTIADVRAKTTKIGTLTGNCIGAAKANEWMMQNVQTARSVTEDEKRPKVLYPLGGGYVAAGNTFINAMLTAAGGKNVAAKNYTGYPKLNDEVILEMNATYLVITEFTTYLTSMEPYTSTTAIEQNNTVFVHVQYMNQPAPRSVVYGVRNLTKGFHSEAAASADWVSREEVEVSTPTPTPTPTPTATATEPTPTATQSPTPTETSSPGFGVATALVALLAAALAATRDH